MVKSEIICNNCESHYIIVTKEIESLNFCPICAAPLDIEEEQSDDDVEDQIEE